MGKRNRYKPEPVATLDESFMAAGLLIVGIVWAYAAYEVLSNLLGVIQ